MSDMDADARARIKIYDIIITSSIIAGNNAAYCIEAQFNKKTKTALSLIKIRRRNDKEWQLNRVTIRVYTPPHLGFDLVW